MFTEEYSGHMCQFKSAAKNEGVNVDLSLCNTLSLNYLLQGTIEDFLSSSNLSTLQH